MWTDHANVTRAANSMKTEDIDAKILRWVAEILGDGSEIRSLGGRSARLADGISRNCGNRDELLEARTQELYDRQGRVKNFDLVKYLSDCEVQDSLQPWAIGDDGYIGKDADVAALSVLANRASSSSAGRESDYWEVLSHCSDSIGGRGWIAVLRVHLRPRTSLFRPDRQDLPQGIPFEEIGIHRETMLQFTDDRQVRPGTWIGEMPDRTKIRPLFESKRRLFEACKAEIQPLLDARKQVFFCEDVEDKVRTD